MLSVIVSVKRDTGINTSTNHEHERGDRTQRESQDPSLFERLERFELIYTISRLRLFHADGKHPLQIVARVDAKCDQRF